MGFHAPRDTFTFSEDIRPNLKERRSRPMSHDTFFIPKENKSSYTLHTQENDLLVGPLVDRLWSYSFTLHPDLSGWGPPLAV